MLSCLARKENEKMRMKCPICGSSRLKIHATVRDERERPIKQIWRCIDCGQQFENNKNLKKKRRNG